MQSRYEPHLLTAEEAFTRLLSELEQTLLRKHISPEHILERLALGHATLITRGPERTPLPHWLLVLDDPTGIYHRAFRLHHEYRPRLTWRVHARNGHIFQSREDYFE